MTNVVQELEHLAKLCAAVRFSPRPADLVADLLAPVAACLRAETASFRVLSIADGAVVPEAVVSLGIPQSVDDAYLSRYCRLDPARRLLRQRLAEPVFPDEGRPGEWTAERASAEERRRFSAEFVRYRNEFLLPNDFFHHVGFCFQDSSGRTLLFDFHRPARAPAFRELERAKARVLAACLHAKAANLDRQETPCAGADGGGCLSPRELEVADAVAAGLTNKEIAARLGISVRTVENHMRSIFAKLGVTTRTRLAARLHAARRSGEPHGSRTFS